MNRPINDYSEAGRGLLLLGIAEAVSYRPAYGQELTALGLGSREAAITKGYIVPKGRKGSR